MSSFLNFTLSKVNPFLVINQRTKMNVLNNNLAFRSLLTAMCFVVFQGLNAQDAETTNQDSAEGAITSGKMLFAGSQSFTNGGPSCIACHNVTNNDLISGGLLAKDLTNVYSRMGDAGLSGILGSPPFPAMASAYRNNKLTEEEIAQLSAFFKHADNFSNDQKDKTGNEIFYAYGPIGLIIWLIVVYVIWFNRKKESVKKDVYDRQIKPIN